MRPVNLAWALPPLVMFFTEQTNRRTCALQLVYVDVLQVQLEAHERMHSP